MLMVIPWLLIMAFGLGLALGVCAQPFHGWFCSRFKGRALRSLMQEHAQRQRAAEARWKSLRAASAHDAKYFGQLQGHLGKLEAALKADEHVREELPPLPPSPKAATPPRRFGPFGKVSPLTHALLGAAHAAASVPTTPRNAPCSSSASTSSPQADEGASASLYDADAVVVELRALLELRRTHLASRP
jgi:hypothetical protein